MRLEFRSRADSLFDLTQTPKFPSIKVSVKHRARRRTAHSTSDKRQTVEGWTFQPMRLVAPPLSSHQIGVHYAGSIAKAGPDIGGQVGDVLIGQSLSEGLHA